MVGGVLILSWSLVRGSPLKMPYYCFAYVINMPAQTGVWRSVPIHTTVMRTTYQTSTAFVTLLKDERIAFRHNEMIHAGCRVSRLVVLLKLLEMTPIKDYYLVKLDASVRKVLSCN
jgi:hypothetical protein